MPNFNAAGAQALNQLSKLPFDNIIGGPLNAAINAQAQAAETTVDFIQSVGMQEVNGQKEAINVQFTYQDEGGRMRRITVPILAILPIPFIVIDTINISFKAKITASAAAQSSESSSKAGYIRGYAGYRGTRFRAALSAGYSAKKDSRASQESKYAVEYTMDVNVAASQAGMPQGMETILGFLQNGMHELPVGVQAQFLDFEERIIYDSDTPSLEPDSSTFKLVVTNANTQPVADTSSVSISSTGDLLASTGGSTTDGIADITLAQGDSFPTNVTVGDEFTDELQITVTTGDGETITLVKPVTLVIT